MELLVHQTEPYRRLKQAALEQVRLLMVMATGLGKTHIAAHFTKNELIAHGRGLFLCHDIDILQQNLAVFREVLGEKYSFGIFYGEQKDFEQVDILFATFQTFHTWKHAFFADEFSFVLVDESEAAFWALLVVSWGTALLYGWSVVAPCLCPGREF